PRPCVDAAIRVTVAPVALLVRFTWPVKDEDGLHARGEDVESVLIKSSDGVVHSVHHHRPRVDSGIFPGTIEGLGRSRIYWTKDSRRVHCDSHWPALLAEALSPQVGQLNRAAGLGVLDGFP